MTASPSVSQLRARRTRQAARRCRVCGAFWSLTVVEHPAGWVEICTECREVSWSLRRRPQRHLHLVSGA